MFVCGAVVFCSVIWHQVLCAPVEHFPLRIGRIITVQSDLTYPHTSILDEIVDEERELDK